MEIQRIGIIKKTFGDDTTMPKVLFITLMLINLVSLLYYFYDPQRQI